MIYTKGKTRKNEVVTIRKKKDFLSDKSYKECKESGVLFTWYVLQKLMNGSYRTGIWICDKMEWKCVHISTMMKRNPVALIMVGKFR
jgi:hypothetical protein